MAAFELSKWYLDCISSSGKAGIAYFGRLQWGPLRLQYSSLIENGSVRHSLRPEQGPLDDGDRITWRDDALDIDGEWVADSPPLHETIFKCDEGAVVWQGLMPRAFARMGQKTGFGYVERLHMTIPPWRIPIKTLRWGRFCCAEEWVVWIDWIGEHNRRIVYRNGGTAEATRIGDERVEFAEGACLDLDCSHTIREGTLGSAALAGIPGLRDTLPIRLLRVNEHKWLSRAQFTQPGRPSTSGWAIHEVVQWPEE